MCYLFITYTYLSEVLIWLYTIIWDVIYTNTLVLLLHRYSNIICIHESAIVLLFKAGWEPLWVLAHVTFEFAISSKLIVPVVHGDSAKWSNK